MKQTIIFFGIIISLIVFWLIGFVNSLNDEMEINHKLSDDTSVLMQNNTGSTIYGGETLSFNNLSLKKKKLLWNSSSVKVEMLELFPDFMEMKTFIEENIEDDGTFKNDLLKKIDDVEFKYIGGSMNTQSAKSALSKF